MDKDMRIFQVAKTALLALAVAAVIASPSRAAEQGSFVIPDAGPKNMATMVDGYFNPAFRALASCSWGTTAPTNGPGGAPIVYQCWANTTANPVVFSYYDGASWVKYGSLNTSTHVWTPSYQGTDLGTASTATTGTSGHTVPFLDGTVTVSGLWSFNSGDLAAVSPAFTGSPTAPTQTVDDNSTKIASTAYVTGQLSAAGDGTPAINGTAALGASTHAARADHVHPTDTSRSPVASPTFTGTPAAPTAAADTNTTQLATTAYVIGQAASATPLIDGTAAVGTSTRYARGDHVHPTDTTRSPVASPTFTGTPAAPTAAVDTNTTQLATTAYVIAQASASGDGTPAMDGAAARGTGTHFARNDHVHPTDTSRAPLASPALTGTPTAPTASPGTNTTQLATTAYADAIAALKANVSRNISTGCGLTGGGDLSADRTLKLSLTINAQTGTSYTVVDGDCGKLVSLSNASAVAVSLPQANGSTFVSGWSVDFQNKGAGTVTVAPTTSTINGASSLLLTQNQGMHCQSDGTNYTCMLGVGAGGGAGTVTQVVCGTGLSGGTITASGTCAVNLTTASNALGADVLLNNTTAFIDGPSVAQGTTGTWFVAGSVNVIDTAGAAQIWCRLWDGTTVIAENSMTQTTANFPFGFGLSGIITNPAANVRISCKDISSTSGKIIFNQVSGSKGAVVSGFRIQ
jgi:hypothetical protein